MIKKSVIGSVNTARVLYILVCELAGAGIANHAAGPDKMWIGIVCGLLVAGFFILVESLMKQFTLRGFSNATVGLLIGLFAAWLLSRVGLLDFLETMLIRKVESIDAISLGLNVTIYASLGFLGAVLALRSDGEDFSLLIPYIRFQSTRESSGPPILLDSHVITDSRLHAILNAGFIGGNLVIPQFVLEELHIMANSPSSSRKERGIRGLETLEKLENNEKFKINIYDSESDSEKATDHARLMHTCLLLKGRLLTTDDNLTKAARLKRVKVLNINDLNKSLKPKVDVGERIRLPLIRTGKDQHQAVGYLPDGTMIVINNAANKINTTQDVVVISTLETDAGTMVFAEISDPEES